MSRLLDEVYEAAEGLRRAGVIDDAELAEYARLCARAAVAEGKLRDALNEGEASPVAEGFTLKRVLDRLRNTPKEPA